jgi:hypothetical protein
MHLATLLLALIVALSGCATCRVETFIKPKIKVGNKVIDPWKGEKGFTYSLTQGVELSLTGCNYLADKKYAFLCIGITPSPETHLKFSSNQYQLGNTQDPNTRTEDMPKIKVKIPFFPDKQGTFPSQVEQKYGLPNSATETVISESQYALIKEFSFPAILEFQGKEVVGSTFTLKRHLRTFSFDLPFPRELAYTTTVQLPSIQINGKAVTFPTIIVERVAENICYRPK